jgi:pimeloyl-ACP methyl ester carboxylesterase
MQDAGVTHHVIETPRHRTAWIEAGPPTGPLMIFVHGWPELGLVWRAQLAHFAELGYRCVAPDLRGYGGSSVPSETAAYAIRELVGDLLELHDALGGAPAVWIGHDWGSPVVWAMASHHAARCRGVVNLCVPYLARGFALAHVVPWIDRQLYPEDKYPAGQWDYFEFYRAQFDQAADDFAADPAATISFLYRTGSPHAVGVRAYTSTIRAWGGWFGSAHRAPSFPRDPAMLSEADFDALVAAFRTTGFRGAGSYYMNDAANIAYADEAPHGGRLALPVLFLHAAWDVVCDTVHSRLAEPMRADCARLTEITIQGGHELQLERPAEVNAAIAAWLTTAIG